MRCWVGQKSQDGGEAVQLLLDVLRQLLVLLVPANGETVVYLVQQTSEITDQINRSLHTWLSCHLETCR